MADLKDLVAAQLAEMRPYLDRSGARVELLGIEDGIAQVHLWLTRPGPNRLVFSLQTKSGIERALRDAVPGLRGVEALNLPPHALLGWDQPAPRPTGLAAGASKP
ncbi:MAG: NifU family protein [Chloroflexi bacterium]|nr:NifU family protein [Chloroflexota bacterium]